jgi:hypothetical protein
MVFQTGGRQSRPQVLPPVPENAGELAHANVLRDIDTYFVCAINFSRLSSLLCGVINRPYHNNYSRLRCLDLVLCVCFANWCLLQFWRASIPTASQIFLTIYSRDHDKMYENAIMKSPGLLHPAVCCKITTLILSLMFFLCSRSIFYWTPLACKRFMQG